MFLRSIYGDICKPSVLFLPAACYSMICIHHIWFICFPCHGQVGHLKLLAVTNLAATNILTQVSSSPQEGVFLGYIPGRSIAVSQIVMGY